jgi:hypothetical protein
MAGYAQWNPATTYVVNDIVAFDGVLYISLLGANTNRQPNSNPTYWATTGASSSITSIVAGAGISVAGTTAITITNAGVRTLTAGTNMTIGGTATDPTVINNGVRSITAGTNITVGGTANIPVINASPNTVRVSSIITSLFESPPSSVIALNNFVGTNPTTAITTTLPAAFTGCTSFTFYIRSLEITSDSTYSAGNVFFQCYLSQTLNTARNDNDGALIYQSFLAPNTSTAQTVNNLVWNWAPTGGLTGNNIYWNLTSVAPTSPTSFTNIRLLRIVYDVVGNFTTLT